MKIKFIFAIFLFAFSCNKKENEVIEHVEVFDNNNSIYNNSIYMDSLRNAILQRGDINAFEKLYDICIHSQNTKEEFYYASIMAKKFNYSKAYYYLYINSRYQQSKNLDKFAVYYLLKAYEGGCEDAKYGVEEIFKNEFIPKSEDYLCINDTTKLKKIPNM
jgi:hypothetical protein